MLINAHTSAKAGGSPKAIDLFWWQGRRADYLVTSVFDLKDLNCREAGVFILVRRDASGQREPLYVGWAGSISDDLCDDLGEPYLSAIAAGANEIHVHFVDDPSCREIITDIAEGWNIKARFIYSLV